MTPASYRNVAAVCLSLTPPIHLAAQDAGAPTPDSFALTHITVVDVASGSARPGMTVVVSGKRITAVGQDATIRVSPDLRRIESRGMFLIPGLWDMHVHTSREGRARWFYPLFLVHGVTGVREMGSFLDTLRYWREERRSRMLGPRIVWSSPMLDGKPAIWRHGIAVSDAAMARILVDSMQRLGFDFLKVYSRLSREVYFAIAEQSRLRGIPFAGHVPFSITPAEASDAGQRSIEHLTGVYESCVPGATNLRSLLRSAEEGRASADSIVRLRRSLGTLLLSEYSAGFCKGLLQRFAHNRTWHVPTLVQERGIAFINDSAFANDPRMRFVPPPIQARWQEFRRSRLTQRSPEELTFSRELFRRHLQLVGDMQHSGVGVMAGTDASDEPWVFAGSSLHDELELLVEAGLTPQQALAAATVHPATYLEALDSLGTIEPGKLADLVILEADPLSDIRNTRRVRSVVFDGMLIDAAARERLFREAEAEARRGGAQPPADR